MNTFALAACSLKLNKTYSLTFQVGDFQKAHVFHFHLFLQLGNAVKFYLYIRIFAVYLPDKLDNPCLYRRILLGMGL